ncbi:DUF6146 family protein [Vaginella massiliensis]|uniref:DUF6146 family protein n=1 Tax=Vaginella massiliensis TaxID=1816680 RepID=UPI000838732C|nr:DUF6146 family protein [Vaginella massiliensis]
MRLPILILILCTSIFGCSPTHELSNTVTEKNELKFEADEDGEYDLIVFDPQYETFLISIAKPKTFFTKQFYKNKNALYVSEWNSRHAQPFLYNSDLYAVHIDYDYTKDYGLNLEYKLYNFFKFIEWKYKVRL